MTTQNKAPRFGDNFSRSKNVPWFQSKLGSNLTPAGRALFQTYSGIPATEVEAHIYKNVSSLLPFSSLPRLDIDIFQRDSAWEIFPWPCIGEFWFITLSLSLHPHYEVLLARLRTQDPPTKLLDLGTCLGQDLRKLVADGAPLQALWGSDCFAQYEAAGHELFCDADRFQDRFITADLLDESPDNELMKTAGTWDVINLVLFLHVYDWDTQVRSCKRIMRLLSGKKGSMVMGATTGSTQEGEMVLKAPLMAEGKERTIYRQSMETFTRMWEEVGRDEELDLKVEVVYDEQADRERRAKEEQEGGRGRFFTSGSTQRRLFFTITIV